MGVGAESRRSSRSRSTRQGERDREAQGDREIERQGDSDREAKPFLGVSFMSLAFAQ